MELSNIRVFPYQSGTILKAPHVCIVSCGAKLGTVVRYPIEKKSLVVSCLPENLALIRVAVKIIEFAGVAEIYAKSFRNFKTLHYKDYGRLLLSILTSVPHSNLFNAYKQIKALPCPSSKAEQASYKSQCKHIAQSSFNA